SRDRAFMRRALALARRGWGQTAPNPMVGAVVVAGDKVVGEGWHERFGEAHAEVHALRAAGGLARGATVYVSLEPCAHHGKTPPCVDALIAAGVARVVCAVRDPTVAALGGAERLEQAGIPVTMGVEESAARELNAPFFQQAREPWRPFVTVKLALSMDAAVADAYGRSKWISGPASRREVHRLRAGHDAVAVGIGTVLADDPSLTVRGREAPRETPRRIVFDRRARLPLDCRLVRTATDTPVVAVVASHADSLRVRELERSGVQIVVADELSAACVSLKELGVRSLLVEGGAGLASAWLAESLLDRLIIFHSPLVLGAGAKLAFAGVPPEELARARRFEVLARKRFGSDLMTVYAPEGSVHRAD
ncbi:MAG TPA: bifunctional diaminohydroxyphosphoribosylaminopyrimidine deaminase/5-amino-6-(5-phosphoribosylamino)uracil reductase RibD, partial [Gemmatimonadaceae bacterium]|nr:bifunctional diaminohydroxyphosphoribosylaminopyrimidine deaminase/5-amino-6-(5-phosphoribosylamino)uracil reductase RibD [Gemmatimonadaceae bacterium]